VHATSYCAVHAPAPWLGSDRKSRLPADWPRRRLRIIRRHGGICHVCEEPGATEVDHLVAGDDHRDANLAPIHRACHLAKSAAEGVAARRGRPRGGL
jgi:5-methylcytosine-specific restriction endonuclease McrA